MESYYSENELKMLNIKFCVHGGAKKIKISRKCSIYGTDIVINGKNVRIDDFCFLSGQIVIGDFVHIAAFSLLNGNGGGILIDDYVNISSRVSIYSNSDDYSGDMMTGPLVPNECINVISQPVKIQKHVIIGANSFVMPGCNIGEGCAFGSYSFINTNTDEWGVYVGIPIRRLKNRSRNLLNYEEKVGPYESSIFGKRDKLFSKGVGLSD